MEQQTKDLITNEIANQVDKYDVKEKIIKNFENIFSAKLINGIN